MHEDNDFESLTVLQLCDRLDELMNAVAQRRIRVQVRADSGDCVVISRDELEALERALEILSRTHEVKRIAHQIAAMTHAIAHGPLLAGAPMARN